MFITSKEAKPLHMVSLQRSSYTLNLLCDSPYKCDFSSRSIDLALSIRLKRQQNQKRFKAQILSLKQNVVEMKVCEPLECGLVD